MRDGVVFECAKNVNEGVHLAQMSDVGGLFERVLADGADVDVFDRSVGELFRMIERGQFVEAFVGNLGDSDVGLARIRILLLRKM